MELGDGSTSAESAASPPLGKGLDPFAKLYGGTRCFLELAAQPLANFLVFLVGQLAQVVLGLIEAEPGNADLIGQDRGCRPLLAVVVAQSWVNFSMQHVLLLPLLQSHGGLGAN